MAISKKDVREFVDALVEKSRGTVKRQIAEFHTHYLDPELSMIIRGWMGDIPALGKRIMTQYEEGGLSARINSIFGSGSSISWNIAYARTMTAELFGTIREPIRKKVVEIIEGRTDSGSKYGEEIAELITKLQKDDYLAELLQRKEGIDKLQAELSAVIDAATTGKQALDRIKALGVDTSTFVEKTSSNLPAIVKLSADVCLLNGTC